MVAAAVGIGTAVAGLGAAAMSSNAAGKASSAQQASAQAGIAEQQRQFDTIQKLLSPYVTAGAGALGAQQNMLGLNGTTAQQQAIAALQSSPYFTAMKSQGENSILANASATGGLRGGNTQGALAQFTPALLAQTFQQQYSNLGGLSSMGQNAAAGVGNAGLSTGQGIAGLLQQQGAAQAGGYLSQGAAYGNAMNSLSSGLGAYGALGGFRSSSPGLSYDYGNSYNPSALMGGDQFGYKGGGSGF
jgi:hypothetical protein